LYWFKAFKNVSQQQPNEVILKESAKVHESQNKTTTIEIIPQSEDDTSSNEIKSYSRARPAEEKLTEQINQLNNDLVKLNEAKNLKLVDNYVIKNQILNAAKRLKETKLKLKRLKVN